MTILHLLSHQSVQPSHNHTSPVTYPRRTSAHRHLVCSIRSCSPSQAPQSVTRLNRPSCGRELRGTGAAEAHARTSRHRQAQAPEQPPTEPSVLAQPRLPGSGSPAPCRRIRSTSWPPRELPATKSPSNDPFTRHSTQHSLISPQARFSPAPNPAQPGPKSPIRRPPSPRPA